VILVFDFIHGDSLMIRWFLLQNRAGRTRLAKYYVPVDDEAKRRTEYDVFKALSSRENKWSNIAEVQTFRRPGFVCLRFLVAMNLATERKEEKQLIRQ